MDNLTHTLAGALLAQTRLREWTPYATTTLVIAANLPDLDIVSRLTGGKAAYLHYHRGVSHALVGVIALAAALTAAVLLLNRLRPPARRKEIPLARLAATALLGLASHPLLDFTNSYGLRPFLPFSGKWVYGDLVFIVDPILWLILGGALFLLTSKTAAQKLAWGGLAVLVSIPVFLLPLFGSGVRTVWALSLVLLPVVRWRSRQVPRSLAATALTAVVAYWGLRGVSHEIAKARLGVYVQETWGESQNLRTAVLPTPGSPFVWRAIVETDDAIYTAEELDILAATKEVHFAKRRRATSDRDVRQALATPRGRVMAAFARFPISRVVRVGDRVEVTLSDARFARGDDMGWCALTIDLPGAAPGPGAGRVRGMVIEILRFRIIGELGPDPNLFPKRSSFKATISTMSLILLSNRLARTPG